MRGSFDPGTAGLCLSYALTASFTLNAFIKSSTSLEADFLHTERVLEYTKLESEVSLVDSDTKSPVTITWHDISVFPGFLEEEFAGR